MDSAHNRAAQRTALYRLFNAKDDVIYVGVTFDVKKRLYQHQRDKPWWANVARHEVEWFDNRQLALDEEERLLEEHDPPYNGSRSFLRPIDQRIDAAAARAGMSRSRWLRQITLAALIESESTSADSC